MSDEVEFGVSSIFGMMTGKGLVVIDFAGRKAQIEPDEARRIAGLLLECAEAAEGDAALVHALTRMGMERDGVGKLLLAMREERERQRQAER